MEMKQSGDEKSSWGPYGPVRDSTLINRGNPFRSKWREEAHQKPSTRCSDQAVGGSESVRSRETRRRSFATQTKHRFPNCSAGSRDDRRYREHACGLKRALFDKEREYLLHVINIANGYTITLWKILA